MNSILMSSRFRGSWRGYDRRDAFVRQAGLALSEAPVIGAVVEPFAGDVPTATVDPAAPPPAADPVAAPVEPALTEAPTASVSPSLPDDSLTVVLEARRPCWIRAALDWEPPLERLLSSGERATFRAHREVLLRVGDAGSLSLTIDGRAAKPLGRAGEVATTRITVANYSASPKTICPQYKERTSGERRATRV